MPGITRFADLHCHPHMRSFNWLHKHRKPEQKSKYDPWWIILPKRKAEDQGRRASAYSQCDMAKVINGNLKLAFLSLYPLEKGWVTGRKDSTMVIARNLKKFLGDNWLNEVVSAFLNKIAHFIGDDKKQMPAIRDVIQAVFMKIPLRRVNFVQSTKYDYFRELKEEREYLLKGNGKVASTQVYIPFQKRIFVSKKKLLAGDQKNLEATGEYVLAKDGQNIKDIIDQGQTAFVLTIEGANVFNSHEDFQAIKSKLQEVKNWEQPIFFITFTHHFYNYLAGHAHSIPDEGNLLLDQSEGINSGFTEKGIQVLRYLLSINDEGVYDPEMGHRILIDVKHLSATARKEYFHDFVLPSLKSGKPIPVIASHVAYSGVEKLDDLIKRMDKEKNGDFTKKNGHKFNNWNINLCDEDVVNIYKSSGLIGINFDQRVLGLAKKDMKKNETHAGYIWQNIKGMMNAVINSADPDITSKKEVVNLFSLGTDFDGYIDPVNKYSTVIDFEQMAQDLIEVIDNDPDKAKLTFGLKAEELVQKICFDNAYDFAVKHF